MTNAKKSSTTKKGEVEGGESVSVGFRPLLQTSSNSPVDSSLNAIVFALIPAVDLSL